MLRDLLKSHMENGHEDGIKYSSALSGRLQHFSQLVTEFPEIREDLVIVDNRICSRSKKNGTRCHLATTGALRHTTQGNI